MKMDVNVLVSDVLCALDLDNLPEWSDLSGADYVTISAIVDDDAIDDAASDSDKFVSAEDAELNALLDQTVTMDLAAAIRRGDTPEAERLLDRLTAEDTQVSDWVQQGRFSRKARAASAQVEGLRKAA